MIQNEFETYLILLNSSNDKIFLLKEFFYFEIILLILTYILLNLKNIQKINFLNIFQKT